jgi:hypothetical protein
VAVRFEPTPVIAGIKRRAAVPLAIFAVCAAGYAVTLGKRCVGPSGDPHYVHLAQSFLHGQLSVVGNKPPGDNDWAKFDGRWYVSFPPFPAAVLVPFVAIWGTGLWDRLVWALLAGLAPAFAYVFLRRLSETGRSDRGVREDLTLTALFAFGTVYYFTAVQGSVWFAAHVVCCALIALYLLWSLDARRPALAGLMLGLAFMTRPPVLFLGLFFVLEALSAARDPDTTGMAGWRAWLRSVRWPRALSRLVWFAASLILIGIVQMAMNQARFGNPFEFGHSHLQVRWRNRIETWGLFNYHYLGRNLAVMLASVPWLSVEPPYLKISRHGLALWVTTPVYFWLLWPRRWTGTMVALALAAGAVALTDLLYQNTGWIQFGYRFSLDYAIALIALLALGARRFGVGFHLLCALGIAINLFGAMTFDRVGRFYDNDSTQRIIFQPD